MKSGKDVLDAITDAVLAYRGGRTPKVRKVKGKVGRPKRKRSKKPTGRRRKGTP